MIIENNAVSEVQGRQPCLSGIFPMLSGFVIGAVFVLLLAFAAGITQESMDKIIEAIGVSFVAGIIVGALIPLVFLMGIVKRIQP